MRFMAARSVNEGRKAAAFNVLLILPISAIVVSNAGWIGRAIANTMPTKTKIKEVNVKSTVHGKCACILVGSALDTFPCKMSFILNLIPDAFD